MKITDDERALLEAIGDTSESEPRLRYADWLDGQGRAAEAELIRLAHRLYDNAVPDTERTESAVRHDTLRKGVADRILPAYLGERDRFYEERSGRRAEFRRGVIHSIHAGEGTTAVPEGLWLNGSLNLARSAVTSLPEGLHVGEDLNLSQGRIGSLPGGTYVGRDLDASHTPLAELPPDLRVGRHLDVSCTSIRVTPAALRVNGRADLSRCQLVSLGDGLEVVGDLDVSFNSGLTDLPPDLRVGGELNLTGTTLTPEAARRIPDMPGLSPRAKWSGLHSAGYPALALQIDRPTTGPFRGR